MLIQHNTHPTLFTSRYLVCIHSQRQKVQDKVTFLCANAQGVQSIFAQPKASASIQSKVDPTQACSFLGA